MELKGIIVPSITIFNENEEIDIGATISHIEFLITNGVKSILILGSIGEFAYLSFNEKKMLIEQVGNYLHQNHSGIQFIVGNSSTNCHESVQLGVIAQNNHADIAIATLQTYFTLEKDQICKYYIDIADQLQIPILAYNIPMATHVDLTPTILKELAENGSIIGVKETGVPMNVIKELIEIAPSNFQTICGTDMQLDESVNLGVKSAILGSSNYIPDLYTQYFSALELNDLNARNDLWKIISKKISILLYGINYLPSIIKNALIATKMPIAPFVRRPLPEISDRIKKKIEKTLAG